MVIKWKIKQIFRVIKGWSREIKNGIKNLIIWFPVIWKDRWWDQYFIYVILRHKLHLMEKNIRQYGMHVNNLKDADNIKKCILLLDRIIKDNYLENAMKNHDKKWGEIEIKTTPLEDDPDTYYSIDTFCKNAITEKQKQQERKEFKRSCEHEAYLKKQDIEMVFKLMTKHIQGWWD